MLRGFWIVFSMLLTFAANSSLAAAPEPERILKAVFVQTDPWLTVVGSDSPTFAMYDDGQVIYRTKDGFRTAKLPPERQNGIISAMTFDMSRTKYVASNATDQPSNLFILIIGGHARFIEVYGALRTADARSRVPKEIVSAYDLLSGFSVPDAVPWLPTYVEVMVSPYEYAPEKSIQWPSGWPDIKDIKTKKRGESYSIFLPSGHFQELESFLQTRNERGAVEINGKKWAVSYRFPFPGLDE